MFSLDNKEDFESRPCRIPYLNGKPMRGVQALSVEDGWMDVMIFGESKGSLDLRVRLRGKVEFLENNDERREEFNKAKYITMDDLGLSRNILSEISACDNKTRKD